jgi:hypothetical protein
MMGPWPLLWVSSCAAANTFEMMSDVALGTPMVVRRAFLRSFLNASAMSSLAAVATQSGCMGVVCGFFMLVFESEFF